MRSLACTAVLLLSACSQPMDTVDAGDGSHPVADLAERADLTPPVGACATHNGGCDANASCTATGADTNSCACKSGYTGDGKSCTIDPCAGNADCDANATCTADGSNHSCACNAGYSGNGMSCTQLPPNPCTTNADCDVNATCSSHQTCACNPGYSGDGKSCKPAAPASLAYASNPAHYSRWLTIAPNAPTTSGAPVVSYSVAPALPSGLALDATTGVISGIPTGAGGSSDYEVSATNSGGAAKTKLTITIIDGGSGALAAGGNSSCALVSGGVQCWGNGPLGNNDPNYKQSTVPVAVFGLSGAVQAVASGNEYGTAAHSCALSGGGLQCWGANDSGQLGNDDPKHATTNVPIQVFGLTSGVQAIATGYLHTCALVDGGVQCWGSNDSGQLGNNDPSLASSNVPVQVFGLTSGVQAIAAGSGHTCALVDGGAQCWGDNEFGDLGNNNPSATMSTVPVQVVGLTSGVQAIATGAYHSCALVNGAAQCWGLNDTGQLGNNDPNDKNSSVPVQVLGLDSGVHAIATGAEFACALVDGGVQCWGDNSHGQIGNDDPLPGDYYRLPQPVSPWAP